MEVIRSHHEGCSAHFAKCAERSFNLFQGIAIAPAQSYNFDLTEFSVLCKVRHMLTTLQPTLWRTCRVLANRTRLQMLGLLFRQSDQTVSAVAMQLKLSLPVASQYLRALEARGLMSASRTGRRVRYRINKAPSGVAARELILALQRTFQVEANPVDRLFKLVTAFTQPRRIEIFRALKQKPQDARQLKMLSGMSAHALARHLRKLESRGFIEFGLGRYSVREPTEGFGRALVRLAEG